MVAPDEEIVVSRSVGLAETVTTSCSVLMDSTTSRLSNRFTVTGSVSYTLAAKPGLSTRKLYIPARSPGMRNDPVGPLAILISPVSIEPLNVISAPVIAKC